MLGDHQTEHRVAEELQALVGRQTTLLVRVRAVGQGMLEQLGVDTHPELDKQRLRRRAGPSPAPTRSRPADQDSRTCRRPLRGPYWPHDGQAVCGRCFSRQAGLVQTTRAGTVAFHCERRCRVLLRDIRLLGTATVSSLFLSSRPQRRLVPSVLLGSVVPVDLQAGELRPPSGRRSSLCVVLGMHRSGSRRRSAHRPAQSGRTHRLERQLEHHLVTEDRLEVDQLALQPRRLVLARLRSRST